MRKILLCTLLLIFGVVAYAADFKVGDAKYQVLPDGTAALKEFKKASGDVVIPEKVTDIKTGKEYTVTSIGGNAFKGSSLTTITLPNTIIVLHQGAFKECMNLTTVKFLGNITTIPEGCFEKCTSLKNLDMNLHAIEFVSSGAFKNTNIGVYPASYFVDGADVHTVWVVAERPPVENPPIIINERAVIKVPEENKKAKSAESSLKELLKTRSHPIFAFIYPNPGKIAIDAFSLVSDPAYMSWIDCYIRRYDAKIIDFYDYKSLRDCVKARLNQANTYGNVKMYHPDFEAWFGVTLKDGIVTDKGEVLDALSAFDKSAEDIERHKFLGKLYHWRDIAINGPENMRYAYSIIEPKEAVKYRKDINAARRYVVDSVYLVKPTLSDAECDALGGFINNEMMAIGADYGLENAGIIRWATNDLLNEDLKTGNHKEEYERILKSCDRYFLFVKKGEEGGYYMINQLAALCGLERWKEAAGYFPNVHRAVTENGTIAAPTELTYIQDAINNHGYKVATPEYSKASKGNKKSKGSSSSDNGSLIEFFTDAAIKMGVERYQKKKAEKEFRELYYQSQGLDKKGRPKKKK
ncbi:MAG: leucine-rich repeat domain-containing protein [Muribaculaceae bacterium]|nr:leucine-rich repeat domain-containing protein [Muribaculaceae bacterium]